MALRSRRSLKLLNYRAKTALDPGALGAMLEPSAWSPPGISEVPFKHPDGPSWKSVVLLKGQKAWLNGLRFFTDFESQEESQTIDKSQKARAWAIYFR